jgi:hypothetical protein
MATRRSRGVRSDDRRHVQVQHREPTGVVFEQEPGVPPIPVALVSDAVDHPRVEERPLLLLGRHRRQTGGDLVKLGAVQRHPLVAQRRYVVGDVDGKMDCMPSNWNLISQVASFAVAGRAFDATRTCSARIS